jgi:septal ring factor EnvC (AmiA/AmiB activator)
MILVAIIFFILGNLTCGAFCWRRLRKSWQAFNAANGRLEIADQKLGEATRKIEAQEQKIAQLSGHGNHVEKKIAELAIHNSQLEQKLSKIRGMAERMRAERNSKLDEKATLPADVENPTAGQHFVFHPLASGPTRGRRSHFFRRR